jgi:glycosyltransferase involved in cell wall biosynthesis
MKLALLVQSISRAGAGVFEVSRQLAQNLVCEHSIKVEVMGLQDRSTDLDLQSWHPLQPQVFRGAGPRSFGFARGLARALDATDSDLAHVHGIWTYPSLAACRWSKRHSRPVIITTHGMLAPWAIRYKPWKKWVAWRVYQWRNLLAAKVIHATSDEEALRIREIGLRQPIAIIPNGVDMPHQIPLRTRDSNPKTALFLGRIHPVKGLLNLVNAWAQASPAGWRMIIAGPDDTGHRADVEKVIKQLGLTDRFSFAGAVAGEAKDTLYREADLFILPSHTENFGLSIAEALTYGVPVITTKGTPWRELESRNAGWWIDPGVGPLACCLREATAISDSERAEMGARGRKLAEERFSWRIIASDMNAVYEWMLGNGTRPNCVSVH